MSRGLFIMAASRLLNPTLDAARIEAEIAEDPEGGRSEWLGLFRSDLAQFLEDELIDKAVVPGRRELPYQHGRTYRGFCDPSGGRHDAMTLAIAHDGKATTSSRLVLDRLLIQRSPFEPEVVVKRFAEQLREFHLAKVVGDRYAAAWVESNFKKCGITYEASKLDKSAIYCSALPLFAQGRVELLDVPKLLTELRLLERTPRAGGRGDGVDHPPRGGTDDAANAVCGALVGAAGSYSSYTHAILHNIRDKDDDGRFTVGMRLFGSRQYF